MLGVTEKKKKINEKINTICAMHAIAVRPAIRKMSNNKRERGQRKCEKLKD